MTVIEINSDNLDSLGTCRFFVKMISFTFLVTFDKLHNADKNMYNAPADN